jgi:prolipoprotein diacylglyceryl transferase
MIWDISPILFRIGPLSVKWYGVFFACGLIAGLQIMNRIYRLERRHPDELNWILLYSFIGIAVGARLGHCLFYQPEYYLAHPLEILKIWKGGLASHGGTAGIVAAMALYCHRTGDSVLWLLDRLCIAGAAAGAFIRIGNLFNSEIYGTPTQLPWGVVFARIDDLPRHPAQVYESLAYFAVCGLVYALYRRTGLRKTNGRLFGVFLMILFGSRFLIEFVKVNQVAFESALPLNMGQVLSLPFFGLGLWLALRSGHSGIDSD